MVFVGLDIVKILGFLLIGVGKNVIYDFWVGFWLGLSMIFVVLVFIIESVLENGILINVKERLVWFV